ncbi:MAG TPA: cupin domain-containing protein [Bryobacteraceae bacterium]|nr:cupin domain-containing protein [Bryobacteraceae bacterium]
MKIETGPETIERILSAYEIGRKLRQLRLRKKIALVELGKHTGLSPSMLSQLENGRLTPTLPTLARISMVFDVGLDYFFSAKRGAKLFAVVRAGERMRFPDLPDSPSPAFFFECLTFASEGKGMQAYLAEFPHRNPRETREHFHEGSEFIHVLEGVLEIHFQGEDHPLTTGDSVYFDSSEPHSYRGASKTGARALVVTSAPRI